MYETIHGTGAGAMTHERRYDEQEIAEIFQAAASHEGPEGRALSQSDGLSLRELQAIGGEVGIAPEHIARAAASLELRRDAAPRRTMLGMPVSAGRTVELPRAPSDREWELLVAELRQTFGAHGNDRSRGDLRAWTNGNLHAYVEPTEEGYRLRMGTVKGNAVAFTWLGITWLVAALVAFAVMFAAGELEEEVVMAVVLALVGTGTLAANAVALPRWAAQREAQMEHVAARALALVSPAPALPGGA